MGDLWYLGFPSMKWGELLSISLDCCEIRIPVSDGKNAWHIASVNEQWLLLILKENRYYIYCHVTDYPQNVVENFEGGFSLGLF